MGWAIQQLEQKIKITTNLFVYKDKSSGTVISVPYCMGVSTE